MMFNKWKVIKRVENNKFGEIQWQCECSCSNHTIRTVLGRSLKNGKSKSCGCIQSEDLTGKKFGKLTIIRQFIDYKKSTASLCECECDCGNKNIIVYRHSLIQGSTQSCGCLFKENSKKIHTIHGLKKHPLYLIHHGMKNRCYNKNMDSYKDYGGRGIIICDEWLLEDGIVNFYNWAINNGYKMGLSIDRIDVNGNYEPLNCKWSTIKEQNRNRRNTVRINYLDKEWSIGELLDNLKIDISPNTVYARLRRGWSVEEAIFTPIIKNNEQGALKVKQFLFQNDIIFKESYPFEDCRDKLPLRFDFAIFNKNNILKCLVEIDGKQHESGIMYGENTNIFFHDEIKNNYCLNNNICLLRIKESYPNIEYCLEEDLLDYGIANKINDKLYISA